MTDKDQEKKGCYKLFNNRQGWVGRPFKVPCGVAGYLCPECSYKTERQK